MSPRQTRAAARAQDAAAAAERQLAATELRRLGLRVPNLKATPSTPRQVGGSGGWRLFGVEPEEQPQRASHLVQGVAVPWFLDESVRVLVAHASTEGILRKSGSLARQRLLKESLESSGSPGAASAVLWSAPVHDVSGLFKEWLQLLPERLLPAPLVQLLLSCHPKHGLEAVLLGVRLLPEARLGCVRHLLAGLAQLSEAPASRMDARNLATVLAPTLCALPACTSRAELASTVSLVEVLIGSAHLVGSAALPARLCDPATQGGGGRKKTNSACVLLSQLRRLVAQRRAPEDGAGGALPPAAHAPKRTKPRELLPRGLSPWKRAKRGGEEEVPVRQQQAAAEPRAPVHEPHEAEDACGTTPEGGGVAEMSVASDPVPCVAPEEEAMDAGHEENREPDAEPMLQRREGLRRGGGSCAASFAGSSLRRGRPNSLRSGLPSPRSTRAGAKRHSSTGSKPLKGQESQRSSFRGAMSDSPFNAHVVAHIAALRTRRNAVSSATTNQALAGGSPPLPKGEVAALATTESCCQGAQEEPMDVVVDTDVPPPALLPDLQAAPACSVTSHDVFALPAPPSHHRRKPEPLVWTQGPFALPSSPTGISGGAGTKRESIIQIRERNAGMVRNNVEVFNRAAAANAAKKAPPQRVHRGASALQSQAAASHRAPLRETNFLCPASPLDRQKPRDWEMEL